MEDKDNEKLKIVLSSVEVAFAPLARVELLAAVTLHAANRSAHKADCSIDRNGLAALA